MLIDTTHPEETRVALINGNKLEEYDYETLVRKQLKGNIYLVKVTRVEPSLQAAFVDFGGNRHGFLPFPEIHPDYYRIPIADREALIAEERAIAAAQAAQEDAEDAAELAASGESLEYTTDDTEDESEDQILDAAESDSYVPKHTGSLAAGMEEDSISEDDDEEVDSEVSEDGAEDVVAEGAAENEDEQPTEAVGEESAEEKEPDLETVGGDVVDPPPFRSSIKRRYKIQEVIKRNQIMLIQISKEERGNKGAAVTSYISLPGRYCVLMPNSPRGGGVSRKVSNAKDRQRLKQILRELNVPEGMSVILRTAGVARSTAEIKRDLDYLLRLWDQIREFTLKSTAPALIYEEGNLIKRAIRDLYRRDIDELHVAGAEGYKSAHEFMRMLMPSHAKKVLHYQDDHIPLFTKFQVESQIDAIHSPTVHLKSGGYIVINPTEALVSIDVNSGRATKGRHIEETALKTNLEAAEEIARQLRLRDQGGLIVIDFIDMEDKRGDRTVEKRLRDAMQSDRARIQLGRISAFGLLELSRQRLHPSLVETNFEVCKHCAGTGLVRTIETSAVIALRAIEEEGLKGRAAEIKISVAGEIALYIFNHKRDMLAAIERRHSIRVFIHADDSLIKPTYNIEILRASGVQKDTRPQRLAPVQGVDISDLPEGSEDEEGMQDDSFPTDEETSSERHVSAEPAAEGQSGRRQGRRHGGRNNPERNAERSAQAPAEPAAPGAIPAEGDDGRNRRRGRRGGKRRGGRNRGEGEARAEGSEGGKESSGGGDRRPRGRDRGAGGRHGQRENAPVPQSAIPGMGEQPRDIRPSAASGNGAPQQSRPVAAEGAHTHRRESATSSASGANSYGDDSNSEKSRKGWWKRLTE
jgi:ribonuclease E